LNFDDFVEAAAAAAAVVAAGTAVIATDHSY
jgi:hypothetical protein